MDFNTKKEGPMKKVVIFLAVITIFWVNSVISHAGIVGDINNDGKIGLEEAIYALQVFFARHFSQKLQIFFP